MIDQPEKPERKEFTCQPERKKEAMRPEKN
jgi:hypothetical protein